MSAADIFAENKNIIVAAVAGAAATAVVAALVAVIASKSSSSSGSSGQKRITAAAGGGGAGSDRARSPSVRAHGDERPPVPVRYSGANEERESSVSKRMPDRLRKSN